MTKNTRAVAEAINPASGQSDLKGALHHVVAMLGYEADIQRRALFHVLKGAFQQRVEKIGIPRTYLADFVLLMQEIGLARHRGAHTTTVWEVVDITFFNEIVTDEWLAQALKTLHQRHESTTAQRKLREKLERKGASDSPSPTPLPEHIEQMGEMVAEVERLNAVVTDNKLRIGQLEAELAAQPKHDASAVAAALVERFRNSKSS